jgi:hypothetical protein
VGLLVTALAHLHVRNLARRNSHEAGSTPEKRAGGALSQQEKNNSADLQRGIMNFIDFI